MLLEEMTSAEFASALQTCKSVFIPFGVLEAHGPHLPLSTDTLQARDAGIRASKLTPLFVAAAIPYGICRSLAGHPGTVSVSGETMRSLTFDLLQSFYAMGLRNFILYSGHASTAQMAAIEEAAERAMGACSQANIAVVLEFDLIRPHLGKLYETPGDLHAGEIEASRILAVRPELVRTELSPGPSDRHSARPLLVRDNLRYWPSAVAGSPQMATVEKGERIGMFVAEYLAELVRSLDRTDAH
jgi:creatinine amidohydrolase